MTYICRTDTFYATTGLPEGGSGPTMAPMGRPEIDDIVTVEELADRVGGAARARRMLREANIPVFAGCFSGSALKAAIGGETAAHSSSPRDTHEQIQRLLGTAGLVVGGLVKRRTLEATLTSRPGYEVFYQAMEFSTDESEHDHDGDAPDVDPDDQPITISEEYPRHARILVKRTERSGAIEFTVGGISLDASDENDFVIFIGPRFDRFWIVSVGDAVAIRNDLIVAKDPTYAPKTPKGFALHPSDATLRVQLSRRPSVFDATTALTERPATHD